jgi:hypothetical protein
LTADTVSELVEGAPCFALVDPERVEGSTMLPYRFDELRSRFDKLSATVGRDFGTIVVLRQAQDDSGVALG